MNNFSIPQKQSLLGVVVMFVNALQKLVRAFWPILLISIVKLNATNKFIFLTSIGIGIVLVGIYAFIQYFNFTFYIDDKTDEFVINKGVLNKSKIAIQLNKIQQVTINQTILQRIIGVYKLEIDTAGSDSKEVTINALNHKLALLLKEKLVQVSTKNDSIVESQQNEAEKVEMYNSTFFEASTSSLLKIGLTSNYIKSLSLLLFFIASAFENLNKLSAETELYESKLALFFSNLSIATAVFFVGIVLISVILIINLVRTIVKYYDFTIVKNNDSLSMQFGLFNTKNTLINPDKVQKLKVTQNYFQRKLDVLTIEVNQASNGFENEKDKLQIPACSESESETILKLIYNQYPIKGQVLSPNIRKLVINAFFLILFPILISFILNEKFEFVSRIYWTFLCLVYLVMSSILVYKFYKHYKLFVSDKHIIKQEGAWDIDTIIIEPHKIQTISTYQYFWQKKTNIGSVTISTAGGNVHFSTANFTEIKQWVNYWLYQVESTNKSWI